MAKYKPAIGDEIVFTKYEKSWSGTITWIAESGFVTVYPHNLEIKGTTGNIDCSVVVEAREILGPKSK